MKRSDRRMRLATLIIVACCAIVMATLAACTTTAVEPDADAGALPPRDRGGIPYGGPTSANPGRSATSESLPQPAPADTVTVPSPAKTAPGRLLPELGGTMTASARPGDPRIGRRFSLDNCRPCHVVAPDQGSTTRFSNAPAFQAIANAASTTRFGLNVWLTNPHPTMPTLFLSANESADVIAYILSLRRR